MGNVPNFVQDQLNVWDALLLAQGLWNTLRLCALGLAIGSVIAFAVGLARGSKRPWLWVPAAAYIEVIRDSPILMQLYVIFFALGIVAVLYFAICYPLSRLALYSERRLKLGG
jgi:His/Glu/Gln/Arg/opine family amino acid ABC transporter permease subunit